MDFIKKHAEKVLFVVLLLGLVLSLFLAINFRAARMGQGALPVTAPVAKIEKDSAVATAEAWLASLTTNPPVLEVATNVFTSSRRKICINVDDQSLIPVDATVCPYCGAAQTVADPDSDGDGIPDRLELLWGLNPNDPSDVHKDLDGDGFPTLYEYQKGTDPTNASSYPPLIDYLRLDAVTDQRMNIELRGVAQVTDKDYTLQLRWQYPGENQWQSGFVRTGTRFGRNNELYAESFTEKRVNRDGRFVDESVAVIRQGRHTLTLRREGEQRIGSIVERSATLKLIRGNPWTQEVRNGQTFELDKISYKVIDIQPDAVVIQPDSGESLSIRAPTAEELEALKPPATQDSRSVPEDLGFDPTLFR